ncbi:hypothetical protein [Bradyrhizobium sp. BWC-3-1]|uniref:hypothetical protein n=1 Tax=Bradyrhizobium sp. BWC-3-1 TaxID=3080012 RepID=UPI00293E594F|nr:hypothetical protein [Bradyrhizobium sp. BWC-3-1]WOH57702.1 hypothetical protein RX329_37055 [Bradyrhizobium sp. BWC-3-1]
MSPSGLVDSEQSHAKDFAPFAKCRLPSIRGGVTRDRALNSAKLMRHVGENLHHPASGQFLRRLMKLNATRLQFAHTIYSNRPSLRW